MSWWGVADQRSQSQQKTAATAPPSVAHQGAPERISIVAYHAEGVQAHELCDGDRAVIGRSSNCDLSIADQSLSRQHAAFTRQGNDVQVRDLGSTNGLHQGGERVTQATLAPGDEIAVGNITVRVQAAAAPGAVASGLQGQTETMVQLEHELRRARAFARSLTVFVLEASKPLSHWVGILRAHLRPGDTVCAQGPNAALGCLLELTPSQAEGLAQTIVQELKAAGVEVRCGLAPYPNCGASVHALIASAFEASRQASPEQPVATAALESETRSAHTVGVIVRSPSMKALYELLERVSRHTLPVLLLGETGTGKEVVARALHDMSARRDRPLQVVNCAAIPPNLVESVLFGHERGAFTGAVRRSKGVFETADGGTVFLDEIGELAPPAQAALLRVLETRRFTRVGAANELEVDVRIVAATHRNLDEMAEAGAFRSDLLHRLNAIAIQLPPLRERREEIAPLAESFLQSARERWGVRAEEIEQDALQRLLSYDWPGNVRELRNVIERAAAVALGAQLTMADLPDRLRVEIASPDGPAHPVTASASAESLASMPFKEHMGRLEAELLEEALRHTDGNRQDAAALLKLPLRTFSRKLATHGISKRRDTDTPPADGD